MTEVVGEANAKREEEEDRSSADAAAEAGVVTEMIISARSLIKMLLILPRTHCMGKTSRIGMTSQTMLIDL